MKFKFSCIFVCIFGVKVCLLRIIEEPSDIKTSDYIDPFLIARYLQKKQQNILRFLNFSQSKVSKVSKQIEEIIDEKCRFLNKSGTSRGSAIHLAQWMKGQLDNGSLGNPTSEIDNIDERDIINDNTNNEEDEEEHIEDWTADKLKERSKELQLVDDNGVCTIAPLPTIGRTSQELLNYRNHHHHHQNITNSNSNCDINNRLNLSDDQTTLSEVEIEDESKSASKSTTSDSQITVRSSPITYNSDKISVCRHCHKNCKLKQTTNSMTNSLKVQHSQSSSTRCCQNICKNNNNSSSSHTSSQTSSDNNSQKSNPSSISEPSTLTDSVGVITDGIGDVNNINRRIKTAYCQNIKYEKQGNVSPSTSTTVRTSTTNSQTSLLNGHHHKHHQENQSISPDINRKSNSSSSGSGISGANNNNTPCNCKCDPKDFENSIRSSQELRKETCKLINSVSELQLNGHSGVARTAADTSELNLQNVHKNCKCSCGLNNIDKQTNNIRPKSAPVKGTQPPIPPPRSSVKFAELKLTNGKMIDNSAGAPTPTTIIDDETDDWSLMLIGLAQIHPTTSLVRMDPFEALPTISVVPPTPEGIFNKFSTPLIWETNKFDDNTSKSILNDMANDFSPEDSPQDEEPPYRSLSTSLKRYGTMSSLEKFSSEEADEKTYNSSEEDDYENDDDIKIITKEVFENNGGPSQNWSNRAGIFLEQSKAFLDSYLGRWDRSMTDDRNGDDMDTIDDCTSGATSGEDVWGTPTSGENDEIQMFNSDQTNSSPTKSSSSLTGDDDTELMMDELLMAPPMTASSIRGLLPRRRLEPLFEEDTESGESEDEKLPPDCSSSDQGQVWKTYIKNGRDLETNKQIESVQLTMNSAVQLPDQHQLSKEKKIHYTGILDKKYGNDADTYCTPVPIPGEVKISAVNIDRVVVRSNVVGSVVEQMDLHNRQREISTTQMIMKEKELKTVVSVTETVKADIVPMVEDSLIQTSTVVMTMDKTQQTQLPAVESFQQQQPPAQTPQSTSTPPTSKTTVQPVVLGLSPRLEMRLALNNDIMGDEDLICYDPGPDLATILGHDLSTFHRFTGRDLISRSASRVVPKEAYISFSQQRNSKMDTPTPNRKKPNPNTWNSSVSVDRGKEKNLTDLERLARQEKKYCTYQLKNSPVTRPSTNHTKNTNHVNAPAKATRPKFFNFLSRKSHNIDSTKLPLNQNNYLDSNLSSSFGSSTTSIMTSSPRKNADKSLDRRFWKQLTKRRRSLTVSEITANS